MEVISVGQEAHNLTAPVTNLRYTYDGFRDDGSRVRYLISAFTGDTYRRSLRIIRAIGVDLDMTVFGISREEALAEVYQNMKKEGGTVLLVEVLGSGIARTECGRERVVSELPGESRCVGYAALQTMSAGTGRGSIRVMYSATRALLPQHRRAGVGGKFLEIGNGLYQPDVISLRTRSGAASASLVDSGLVRRPIFPLGRLYDEDLDMTRVLETLAERTLHPNPVDMVTGITKAVYSEGRDRVYIPDQTHKESYEAYLRMIELGLDPDNGDGMYIAARVIGRPRIGSPAVSLPYSSLNFETN